MARVNPLPDLVTADEYLEAEKTAAFKNEFVDGVIYAMSGVTETHNDICVNITAWLHARVPTGCRVFGGSVKLRTKPSEDASYYYPDAFTSCGPRQPTGYVRDDAILVVEVLSKTTERIDKGEKFLAYTAMPSVLEYLIVSQDGPRVEVFRRSNAWKREIYDTSGSIKLDSITQSLAVADIYHDIPL